MPARHAWRALSARGRWCDTQGRADRCPRTALRPDRAPRVPPARWTSSTWPARMYCRTVSTPPPILDVHLPRCLPRALQRRVDASGDEVKGGATVHLDRRARMVRQHEGRRVIGRAVAPPPSPLIIGPSAADGAEHVRPRMKAPKPSIARRANSSSGPVSPPLSPCISRKVRVGKYHSNSSGPRLPRGCSRLYSVPAE